MDPDTYYYLLHITNNILFNIFLIYELPEPQALVVQPTYSYEIM